MPHIKPRYLNGQRGTGHHASFDGIAFHALAVNDIVIAVGYDGDRIKWAKADANDFARVNGVMGIADHAAGTDERVRVVSHKLITGVNTDAATAVGHPVYLTDAAGVWGVAESSTTSVVVGSVVADHLTTGAVLLAPAHCISAIHTDGTVKVTA